MVRGMLAGMAFVCLLAGTVLAQDYPSRPVKILVPTSPGGFADTLARALGAHLGKVMGQQFYVENRGGAANIIGIESVVQSPADGYTLLLGAGTITINQAVYKKLPYDVARDLTPITQMVSVPNVLAGHPSPALLARYRLRYVFIAPGQFGEYGIVEPEDLARTGALREVYANDKGMRLYEIVAGQPPAAVK